MKAPSRRDLLLWAAVAGLLVGFILQTRTTVAKWLAGRTTTSIELHAARELPLPALSLCPGYKGGGMATPAAHYEQMATVTYFDAVASASAGNFLPSLNFKPSNRFRKYF